MRVETAGKTRTHTTLNNCAPPPPFQRSPPARPLTTSGSFIPVACMSGSGRYIQVAAANRPHTAARPRAPDSSFWAPARSDRRQAYIISMSKCDFYGFERLAFSLQSPHKYQTSLQRSTFKPTCLPPQRGALSLCTCSSSQLTERHTFPYLPFPHHSHLSRRRPPRSRAATIVPVPTLLFPTPFTPFSSRLRSRAVSMPSVEMEMLEKT